MFLTILNFIFTEHICRFLQVFLELSVSMSRLKHPRVPSSSTLIRNVQHMRLQPDFHRHQCTYPVFCQRSPESWLRAHFEACRWGQCTIHLQVRGFWAQTPVKVSGMQWNLWISASSLTVCVIWYHERICWASTHIFQEISGNYGGKHLYANENKNTHTHTKCISKPAKEQLQICHLPQVKDTRRCFLVPGKQGSPKSWVSAISEQFALPWHLRDTFLRATGDKHSEIISYKLNLIVMQHTSV